MGSASELEYLLLLSKDLGIPELETHHRLDQQGIEVKKMLLALINKLKVRS